MPYTVVADADGCAGYAVVKQGTTTPIPGGCHSSKAQAIAHMVAIQANYEADRAEVMPETEAPEAEQPEAEETLELLEEMQEYGINARQAEMYDAYEEIAERYGKWLKDIGPDGAHYISRSPFDEEGLLCSNCVFFQGGRMCEIVAGDIAPEGICKLWVIGERNVNNEPMEEGMEYESRAEISLVAPLFMRASARRGLALHEEGKSGGGLRAQTVEDARKMAAGQALSEQKWRKIGPWIARHTVDLDAVDEPGEITPGLVAMLLWGGGSSKSSARRAQSYAENLVARLEMKGESRVPVPQES
jgi:hypothetical protein